MLYIFTVFLVFYIFFAYVSSNRTFISVSLLTGIMFFLSTIVLIINNRKWKFELSFDTFVVMFLSLMCIMVGELVARVMYLKGKDTVRYRQNSNYVVSNRFFVFSIFIVIVTVVLYFIEVRTISSVYGEGAITGIADYRKAKVGLGISDNVFVSILKEISYCFCIVYIYIFINGNRKKKYLIPIILYLIIILLSSGRAQIIYIIAAVLVILYHYFRENKKPNKLIIFKMIKISTVLLVLFLVSFYALGFLTGKSSIYSGAFENISVYLSSSIMAVDSFIKSFQYNMSNFGNRTLFGIISFLRRFGIDIAPNIRDNYLPFIYFPNMHHTTNVYTYLGRLIYDYNVVGTYIVSFGIGYIYTKVWLKISYRKYKNLLFVLLMYASYFYPVIYSIFDFKYFDILSVTGIVHIIILKYLSTKVVHLDR